MNSKEFIDQLGDVLKMHNGTQPFIVELYNGDVIFAEKYELDIAHRKKGFIRFYHKNEFVALIKISHIESIDVIEESD